VVKYNVLNITHFVAYFGAVAKKMVAPKSYKAEGG